MTPKAGLKTPLHRTDWRTVRLKFLLERKIRPIRDDDGVVTAFRDGVVTLRSNRREEGFTFADKEIGYQGVEPGDLVIHAMDGFAGAIGISDSRGKCSPVCTTVVPRTHGQVHPQFCAYYLRNLAITGFIESLAKGIRERSTDFRWKDAGNLLVNFPDYSTQAAIADFLDREIAHIDQLIAIKNRQSALLAERKLSAIQELAQGKLYPADKQKQTGNKWFPVVPEHWERVRLRFLFRATKRQGWPDLDVLSVYRDYGVILKSSRNDNINKTPEDLSSYQLVETGDLVINKMKAWQGSLGIAEMIGITSPDYLVFKPVRPMIGRYIHHLLRAQPMPALFSTISNGIRTDQWRLEYNKFLDIPVWLPPLAEQQEIAKKIDNRTSGFERIAQGVLESIKSLQERRSTLITAAVTGRIDIAPCKTQWRTSRTPAETQEFKRA